MPKKGWRLPVSANRRRRRGEEQQESSWLATYGDMVTLLLAFFVMMFAFSNLDRERFHAIITAFQGSVGVMEDGRTITEDLYVSGSESPLAEIVHRNPTEIVHTQEILRGLAQLRDQADMDSMFAVETSERGIIVHFTEGVLFDLGRAELKPEAKAVLHQVFDVVLQWPYQIRIEGHTDNWPIDTLRFPSNWELSTARAARVVRFAIDERSVSPDRLSAAGYGEYRPIASNATPEGRSKNRRVDIVLISSQESEWEPTARVEQ